MNFPARRLPRILRLARNLFLGVVLLLVLLLAGAWLALRGSLPRLDGEQPLPGLSLPVSVTRDAIGTVSITAAKLPDAMRALGFAHAQERFFEMDLTRRSAAGELSALLGGATLAMDKDKRRHRMRARMSAQWQSMPAAERASLTAYADGVNAGLNALSVRPWQYLILRAPPETWREVDSMLVVSEMYFMLQARGFDERFSEIRLRQRVGDRLFNWLKPSGGEWDAALDGSVVTPPAMPEANEIDTRQSPAVAALTQMGEIEPAAAVGSNNWAIGGALTGHGGAMLADDMHLGLGVPNIWFRAQLKIGEGAGAPRVAGVSLPGLPAMVVGSNGHVAWGFTNGYGQWFDWVALPKAPAADQPPIIAHREIIAVKGGESVEIDVRESPWGPILRSDTDHDYALSWVLYRDGSVNLRAGAMMFAQDVDQAIAIARESGMPHQNALIADRKGNLAWTIMGRIPESATVRRHSTRGQLTPVDALPTGWLAADRYPLVRNPADARLWTANNRQLGPVTGQGGDLIGDGGFDLGARALQIRDRLRAQQKFDEKDLHAIQLDDESRFLKRWAALAQSTATTRNSE
jgi:penicillin amidase